MYSDKVSQMVVLHLVSVTLSWCGLAPHVNSGQMESMLRVEYFTRIGSLVYDSLLGKISPVPGTSRSNFMTSLLQRYTNALGNRSCMLNSIINHNTHTKSIEHQVNHGPAANNFWLGRSCASNGFSQAQCPSILALMHYNICDMLVMPWQGR